MRLRGIYQQIWHLHGVSNLHIQTIEQLDNMYSVNRLIEDALCTFADRVKEYKTKKVFKYDYDMFKLY